MINGSGSNCGSFLLFLICSRILMRIQFESDLYKKDVLIDSFWYRWFELIFHIVNFFIYALIIFHSFDLFFTLFIILFNSRKNNKNKKKFTTRREREKLKANYEFSASASVFVKLLLFDSIEWNHCCFFSSLSLLLLLSNIRKKLSSSNYYSLQISQNN